MKINNKISSKVLVISEDIIQGKGGVVAVAKTFSKYYEQFNHIPSTNQKGKLSKLQTFIKSLFMLPYCILFKSIKIIHIHGASYGSFFRKGILILISKLFGAKVVYHMHGGEFKAFYKRCNKLHIIDFILKRVDILVVLSKEWEDFFTAIIDSHKIDIINNIVEHPKVKKEHKLNGYESLKLLFLGVIEESKGIFDLLDVIARNREQLKSKLELYIGGQGKNEKLKEIIAKNDLQSIVIFKGWVSGSSKDELFTTCNVYVLPSYNEGLPISILEAMSYHMPIISTRVGGIPAIVKDGKNGILFTPGDKDAILNAILYFANNIENISDMGLESSRIVSGYYPEAVIPKLENIYKKLLNN